MTFVPKWSLTISEDVARDLVGLRMNYKSTFDTSGREEFRRPDDSAFNAAANGLAARNGFVPQEFGYWQVQASCEVFGLVFFAEI